MMPQLWLGNDQQHASALLKMLLAFSQVLLYPNITMHLVHRAKRKNRVMLK
jgi:hypothetical protein